jgi:hypothetical protein
MGFCPGLQVLDGDIRNEHVCLTIFEEMHEFAIDQFELAIVAVELNLNQNHLRTSVSSAAKSAKKKSPQNPTGVRGLHCQSGKHIAVRIGDSFLGGGRVYVKGFPGYCAV